VCKADNIDLALIINQKRLIISEKRGYIIDIDHRFGGIMKNSSSASSIVFLVALVFIFVACPIRTEDTGEEEIYIEKSDYTLYTLGRLGLDEDVEWQILLSCKKKLRSSGRNVPINDIWIEKYYGPYCPAYQWTEWCENWTPPDVGFGVQWLDEWEKYNAGWDTYEAEHRTLVAVVLGYKGQDTKQRVRIYHNSTAPLVTNGNHIFLWDVGQLSKWNDGQLSTLKGDWYLLFSEDFLSITNQQNGLDLQTQIRIQEDFGKYMKPRPWTGLYKYLRIQYLGTYNSYIIMATSIGTNAAEDKFTVGGVLFTWSTSHNYIFAWKEGEIFELPDLYERGLITREDLLTAKYEKGNISERE
jgi:hypothetical protein